MNSTSTPDQSPAPSGADSVRIRPGRLKDYRTLVQIEKNIFGRHALDASIVYWLLLRRWPGIIVAEENGRLLGHVITRLSLIGFPHKRGGISSIAVVPEYRRRGLARRLMNAAIDFLKSANARPIELEVDLQNDAAVNLYRSLGFTPGPTLTDYYGPGKHGMRMTLEQPNQDNL